MAEEPQEMVHKLQRAAQYASRQMMQQEGTAAQNQEPQTAASVLEQRSQIAIIQMAPPAPGIPSRNVSTVEGGPRDTEAVPSVHSSKRHAGSTNKGIRQQGKPNNKKKRHHCAVHGCMYSTPHTKDLTRHMRKHTGEKPYNCDRCTKSFTRYDKLVLHIRTHEGYRPFSCHVCNHAATDSSSLKKHLRTHNDERPYKCQLCSYASKDSSQLVVHLRHHTGDCPYTCSFVGCDAAFKTPSDLSRHTRLHTGEKPYKCTYCDYSAAVKCNLNAHMKRHTNPIQKKGKLGKAKTVAQVCVEEEEPTYADDIDETDVQVEPPPVLPFQYACKLCDFKADTIDHFGIHMRELHPDVQFNLQKSGLAIKKSKASKVHRNLTEQRNFKCTSCKAAFVCEEALKCHMRQHAPIPNLPANVAPKLYTPTKMRVFHQSRTNNLNGSAPSNHFTNNSNAPASNYTLHEMQRVPLGHSVITENPTLISNGASNFTNYNHTQQHQNQFQEVSADEDKITYVTYSTEDDVSYRNHGINNMMYHLHEAVELENPH